MRETDFLGGNAGRLSSLAGGGTTFDSSPISAPFIVGLETSILLRLGGRAGDFSPLKQNEENSKLTGNSIPLSRREKLSWANNKFLALTPQ